VPLNIIYRVELSDNYAKVCDMVTEIPIYGNSETGQSEERRTVLGKT
jgi:hypothetical protein